MEQVAAWHGPVTEIAVKYFGKRFRECLQTLASPKAAKAETVAVAARVSPIKC
jgi:hypothetical protein